MCVLFSFQYFICTKAFPISTNGEGRSGINDSKSITMQNHAIIKMNSACRDYISLSQMWGIFEWYMIFCNFFLIKLFYFATIMYF